ncbi:hypothetical protein D3C81_2195270 [compost metagenome]
MEDSAEGEAAGAAVVEAAAGTVADCAGLAFAFGTLESVTLLQPALKAAIADKQPIQTIFWMLDMNQSPQKTDAGNL